MNIELFREIFLNAGPYAALAVFAIWRLEKVWEARLEAETRNVEAEQRHSEEIKALYLQSLHVIEANTQAMTELSERLEQR